MSSTSPGSESQGLRQVVMRRTVISVAVVAVLSVPYAVFAAVSGQWAAASWTVLGGVAGLVGLLVGGPLIAYAEAGLLVALTPLSIVSGTVPVAGASLMALMCVGVGLTASRGLSRTALMVPVLMASMLIAPPHWSGQSVHRTTTSYLLWMVLFIGGGALWACLVFARLLRGRAPARAGPSGASDTIAYTVLVTVPATLATLGVLIWRPGSQGAWLVVTLLVVTEVGHEATVKRVTKRVIGTVAGVAIAALLASVTSSEPALLTLGFVMIIIAGVIRQGPHYTLYMAFMTPAVVLFSSSSIADVPGSDTRRLVFTLIGSAAVLAASALTVAWRRHQTVTETPGLRPGAAHVLGTTNS